MNGEQVKLQVFALRSMVSGAAFHRAYQRATQQAFLEAHEQAFHYFGGVFRLLRYDNLKSAVKKVLRGHQREETTRFIAFRSHWRFESDFCTPAEPHEKGGIEGEGGYFRRSHWVPMPKARDLAELNAQLLAACREDEQRQIAGHPAGGSGDDRGARAPVATGGAGLRADGGVFSAGGWVGMCASADQFVLGSGQTRADGRSAALPGPGLVTDR